MKNQTHKSAIDTKTSAEDDIAPETNREPVEQSNTQSAVDSKTSAGDDIAPETNREPVEQSNTQSAVDTKKSDEDDVAPETNKEPVEEDTPLAASVKQPEGGQERYKNETADFEITSSTERSSEDVKNPILYIFELLEGHFHNKCL